MLTSNNIVEFTVREILWIFRIFQFMEPQRTKFLYK